MQHRYTLSMTLALALCAIVPNARGQWVWGADLQVTNGLSRVDASHFMSATEGFVGGNSGGLSNGTSKILRTTNGGMSWSPVYTANEGGSIVDMVFVSDQVGLASVGSFPGKILKTVNGGSTWSVVSDDSPWGGSELSFPTAQIGFGVGANLDMFTGMVQTVDGGDTWTTVDFPMDEIMMSLDDVAFTSPQVGYVVGGEFSGQGKIVKTTDGGTTWQVQTYPGLIQFNGVYFRNASFGVAYGAIDDSFTGTMVRTTNGGATWTTCTFDASVSKVMDVEFLTDAVGYALSLNGSIFITTDGGATWNLDYSGFPFVAGAYTISFAEDAGYAFGLSTFFLKNASLTSIDELGEIGELRVAPNPMQGDEAVLVLDDPNMAGTLLSIEVMNALGTIVHKEPWTPSAVNEAFPLRFPKSLASGTYVVRVSSLSTSVAPRTLRVIVP